MSQVTRGGDVASNSLAERVELAGRTAESRVVFGPHETNRCRGRAFSDRSIAYYERRAKCGAGMLVTEFATAAPPTIPTSARPSPSAHPAGP